MLAITLGDPLSVNIELITRVLQGRRADLPIVLIGDWFQWQDQHRRLGLEAPDVTVTQSARAVEKAGLYFLPVGTGSARPAETLDARERGAIAKAALDAVMGFTKCPRLAVLTMPIDKYAATQAGFAFPGQTEWFEHLWQGQAVMTLAGPKLKVGLVTNHLALRDVPDALTSEKVAAKARRLLQTLRDSFGIAAPRLAVTGLNPHAGDQGLFGDEDAQVIRPAVEELARQGHHIEGPLPADTAFAFAYQGRYDGVLAMYHDQGLGPLKLVHFDDAVNLSGGLKHLRVSPDHGPAANLFLQKKASEASTAAAFALCQQYL